MIEEKLYQMVIEEAEHIFHVDFNTEGLSMYGLGRAQMLVDQLLMMIKSLRKSSSNEEKSFASTNKDYTKCCQDIYNFFGKSNMTGQGALENILKKHFA